MGLNRRRLLAANTGLALVAIATLVIGMPTAAGQPPAKASATSPVNLSAKTGISVTSPVDLSTKVDMVKGYATSGATVTTANARFQVLSTGLVRLEYSPSGEFLDAPTFNVLDRRFDVPNYQASRTGNTLTITTAKMVLEYQLGSGPFTVGNTTLMLLHPAVGSGSRATPTWLGECTFGQQCQSGSAALSGGAQLAALDRNYVSASGYVTGLAKGATSTWSILGAPAGTATLTVRYANTTGAAQTLTLAVNGTTQPITLQPTGAAGTWGTYTSTARLAQGTNNAALRCDGPAACNVDVDQIAFATPGSAAAPTMPAGQLGGYIRSFDSTNGTYTTDYSSIAACPTGTPVGVNCVPNRPAEAPALLNRSGWYMLDDTRSDVWTNDGWITARPNGDVQDGYLFGFGDDYRGALQDLAKITGPAPLLPSNMFGNWFTQLSPQYTAAGYENTLYPQFKANGVSLDQLSIDTNWKGPVSWNGWNWNPQYFPNPTAFLDWAHQHGIHVALNIHSSISPKDPKYAQAVQVAGGSLPQNPNCISFEDYPKLVPCAVWDWAKVNQAQSNFAVQQGVTDDGVDSYWLDWCCDGDFVSSPGVTPDGWINHLYAQSMINQGERGYVTSRIGGAFEVNQAAGQSGWAGKYVTGPWADHRSAIHFTGDTNGTWATLAYQAQLSQDEGSIGQPYVSDDIGSFSGPPAAAGAPRGGSKDPDDLYLRWLQLGVFQPILRMHSTNGGRLPWEYDNATKAIGDSLLRLRSQLVPYLYNLAHDATQTGLPMTRALYLNYPDQEAAYNYRDEYLLGDDVLVAPVTTPGTSAQRTVWFPPGTWTDWFTGKSFQGPVTKTLTVPLNQMPVFVRAGGIVPLAPANGRADQVNSAPLTIRAYPGSGTYNLYQDAGQGLAYQHGQFATTTITTKNSPRASTVTIGKADGRYQGQPTIRSITVELKNLSRPGVVRVNGRPLAAGKWTYNTTTKTVSVPVSVSRDQTATITQFGGRVS